MTLLWIWIMLCLANLSIKMLLYTWTYHNHEEMTLVNGIDIQKIWSKFCQFKILVVIIHIFNHCGASYYSKMQGSNLWLLRAIWLNAWCHKKAWGICVLLEKYVVVYSNNYKLIFQKHCNILLLYDLGGHSLLYWCIHVRSRPIYRGIIYLAKKIKRYGISQNKDTFLYFNTPY